VSPGCTTAVWSLGLLDALIARRGRRAMIVSDNGTELTSRVLLEWTNRTGTLWHYIAPGKPTQNAFVESFIGRSATSA
jgi:putative transposase